MRYIRRILHIFRISEPGEDTANRFPKFKGLTGEGWLTIGESRSIVAMIPLPSFQGEESARPGHGRAESAWYTCAESAVCRESLVRNGSDRGSAPRTSGD